MASSSGSSGAGGSGQRPPSPITTRARASTSSTRPGEGATGEGATGATSTEDTPQDTGVFECNICLDTAKDAVVSMCGHLFCWPCLHQWLETRPIRPVCPVCKAGISKEKVVPLYGRGSTNQTDPREKLPPRPPGQRTEPENNASFPGFSMSNGFHVSFGIGAFPFGLFASSFNFNDGRPPAPEPGTPQHEGDQFLSNLFLGIAVIFFIWLLIA